MPLPLSSTLGSIPLAAIDFESAGAAPGETDQPVQVGIVRLESLSEKQPSLFTSYIACTRPVRWSASKVHGITTAHLQNAPDFPTLWPELKQHLQDALVIGHNPSTEKRFLRAFPGHGFGPWLDTLQLARQAIPQLGDYTLSCVCRALGLEEEIRQWVQTAGTQHLHWHDALFDAAASLLLLRKLLLSLQMEHTTLEQIPFAIS